MKMPPPTADNHSSRLLGNDGNLQVFKLLGNRCQSIATTVAQLYCTQLPNHSQWHKMETGVLCFVKDNTRKNYFFRIFCLKRNLLVWEHEMYNNMEYIESTSFLHIFEGEEYLVAFNFADQDEARYFKSVIEQKICIKKRKEEKRARHSSETQSIKAPLPTDLAGLKKNVDPASKQARRKRNLTKADISQPTDFKHISHVGWNPESGFDINSQDEQLTTFFEKAGVSEKQLQDRDTREFIYDFINKHGGRDAVAEINSSVPRRAPSAPQHPLPPVPPRGTPRPPHIRAAPPPPPVVNISDSSRTVVNLPPERPTIPPPPSAGFSQTAAAPPPPPPPPMGGILSMPEANVMPVVPQPPMAPPAMDNTSALMESIRSGTSLKPVEERKVIPPQEDARGDLLSEIRKGLKLKPVDERDIKPVANLPSDTNSGDLAGALARALAERSKAIHSEDDDDDDEDFNDDEWD